MIDYLRRTLFRCVAIAMLMMAATGGGSAQAASAAPAAKPDALYVGNRAPQGNPPVVRFRLAGTGLSGGEGFVLSGQTNTPHPNALNVPSGLIFERGELWVANQNADTDFTGGINRYGPGGDFLGALISAVPCPAVASSCDNPAHAPFAPRGIVVWGNRLIVASIQGPGPFDNTTAPDGEVDEYTLDGTFLGTLPAPPGIVFHPRAAVVGPDGALYVTNAPNLAGTGGQVLRYPNPSATSVEVAVDCPADAAASCKLNRPEGLVFGPDRTLYVTSFRDGNDTANTNDKILEYSGGPTFTLTGQIDLDQPGKPRTFAQALLFGPGGGLYVPISNTGEIRRYDVTHPTQPETLAPPSKLRPFYLTFGLTNPSTLAYNG